MKIILSRKGFDGSAGKVPSPIFMPSNELCSLPIPETTGQATLRYRDITVKGQSLGKIVHDLTKGKINPDDRVHLDPDLTLGYIPRLPNWKPVFGALPSADTHLHKNHNVDKGDIFLFFGWFKKVERIGDSYRYVAGSPDLHIIFGWLQIEQRIQTINAIKMMPWLRDHPHVQPFLDGYANYSTETLYISTERLQIPGVEKPGAGMFKTFNPTLCLTEHGQQRRSIWRLPSWFYPSNKTPLSYHSKLNRWTLADDHVLLQSVRRGQEFVLNCDEYPEAISWVSNIFRSCS